MLSGELRSEDVLLAFRRSRRSRVTKLNLPQLSRMKSGIIGLDAKYLNIYSYIVTEDVNSPLAYHRGSLGRPHMDFEWAVVSKMTFSE